MTATNIHSHFTQYTFVAIDMHFYAFVLGDNGTISFNQAVTMRPITIDPMPSVALTAGETLSFSFQDAMNWDYFGYVFTVTDEIGHRHQFTFAFANNVEDFSLRAIAGDIPQSLIDGHVAETGSPIQYLPLSSIAAGGSVATTPQQPTTAPNLTTASNWAHNGINQAFELGLIPAALQNNYTSNATRAEFSAFAVALYETATGREIAGRMEFNDTNDINVQKMGYLGVVTGVGGGNFAPNNSITREQAAVMIARLAYTIGQPLQATAPTFADNAQISSWAVDAVGQVQAAGIMGGVGDNQFAPSGDYTREQSIITMLRLFEILN